MKFNVICQTAGDGLWSNTKQDVQLVRLDVPYINKEQDFGELRVYFDRSTWNIKEDGLIYTDSKFLKDLQAALLAHGLSSSVDYSEQGMQGVDFVSLDVDKEFLQSWASALDLE